MNKLSFSVSLHLFSIIQCIVVVQVFQCEVLLGKVQTCSLEVSRILLQLSQASPATSSVQGVEVNCSCFIF